MERKHTPLLLIIPLLVLFSCVQVQTEEPADQEMTETPDTGFVEVFANKKAPKSSDLDSLKIQLPEGNPLSGKVDYTIEINIKEELAAGLKGEQKALAAFLPDKMEQSSTLLFMGPVGRVRPNEDIGDGGPIQMQSSGLEMIVDLESGLSIGLTTLGQEEFAVKEKRDPTPIEILDETKEILGHTCKKAKVIFEETEGYAWFTEEIPFGHTPFGDIGLPGLVLELQSKKIKVQATAIELRAVSKDQFTVPGSVKYVTDQQLQDFTSEMMDKLGGNVMVKTIK